MSEISQTYLAMVRREHQPVTGFDRAICGRCGAVDRREGYPCAALVLLDALATERARAEAAEGREARYLAALLVAERNTTDELIGHGSNLLRMCRVCDQVGEQGHIPHAPDCPFAALAGTPEDQPLLTPRESYPATIRVTEVRRGQPAVYPDEVTAFACGGGTHVVAGGEAVCQCGENRMELLL